MADGTSAILHINRLKSAHVQVQNNSVTPLSKNLKEAVKLKQHKEVAPKGNIEVKVEEADTDTPPHSRMRNVESEESDESEEEIVNLAQMRIDDPEWTPGSSYQHRKLQSSNTADDVTYTLRSRLVSRSERETEVDKEQSETDHLSESEHVEMSTQKNKPPSKNEAAMNHSYNLISKAETTSNKA